LRVPLSLSLSPALNFSSHGPKSSPWRGRFLRTKSLWDKSRSDLHVLFFLLLLRWLVARWVFESEKRALGARRGGGGARHGGPLWEVAGARREDEPQKQPRQGVRLPAQVPAGRGQRCGQGGDPVQPAGRRQRVPVRLQHGDTSGQGRFCTIFRSYSRGAQGVILVYDITNRWSFDGIDRWIKEIDEHAPGVPKILVGNRLHLAYKRQVTTEQAQVYAERLGITFFEVSPLCNFNITESFTELARIVLMRHGMERLWRPNKVLSLQDLCCRSIVSCTPVHLVDKLPLPVALKSHLKSFSMANGLNARMMHGRSYSVTANGAGKRNSLKKSKLIRPPQSPSQSCTRNSCKIS
uniref:small monomeric GTPase n=2 Tax=Scleropages formosus TaxID=113540 RepID=A0A8C9VQ44_SCLFO